MNITYFLYTVKIFAGIVFSWLLPIPIALLRMFTGWKDVAIFNTFAFFVVPLVLIVAAYIAIFFAAKKSLKEHRRRSLKKVTHTLFSFSAQTTSKLSGWDELLKMSCLLSLSYSSWEIRGKR